MADDIIGSLGVQIEADASDLKGQYDEAVRESEAAAERIAGAFESLVGIGEALAITEGLKEFGQEALNAYGTVQSVTVAITNLTGSATAAGEAIEAVKQIAATQPFAFPELAPTAQRMIALGVEVERLPLVLQTAANAASATGNSIDAVANSIERMALSGNAGARQLVQLGLNTEQLAKVMGVTADEVKKAFAAMDESARLDVLTTALQKFAGAAAAQADTVKGAWQILQNKFEEVMVGVGAALEPAVKDIIAFGTVAVEYAQRAIDAFNSLPEPVKEFAGAAALATASLAPLTVAVGTLGLGITGIAAAMGPLKELFGVFGTEAATAAVAEGEVATEAAAVAEGVGAAGLAMGGLEVAIGLVGGALAGLQLKDQVEQWKQIYTTLKENSDVFFGLEKDIAAVARALVDATGNALGFQGAWAHVVAEIKATPIQDFLAGPLADANNALKVLNVTLQATAGYLPAADAMAKQISGTFQTMADKSAAANPLIAATFKAFEDGKKHVADATAAVEDWWKAVDKLPKAYEGLITSADAFLAKERDVTVSVGYAKAALDSLMATNDGTAEHQRAVNDALTQYIDKLKASGALMTDQITINIRGVDVVTTLGNAIKMLKNEQGDWNTATQNGVSVLRDHTAAVNDTTSAVQAFNAAAPGAVANLDAISQAGQLATDTWNSLATAVGDALDKIGAGGQGGKGIGIGGITAPGAEPKVGDIRVFENTPGTQYGLTIDTWTQALIDNLHAAEAATKQYQQYTQQLIDSGVASGNTKSILQDLTKQSEQSGVSMSVLVSQFISHEKATTSLANATSGNASALATKTTATTTATNATNTLSNATTSLGTAAQNAASTVSNVTSAQQQFVDGLGNVYNSYQALVDAIRNNPLLSGPATSTTSNLISGPSSFTPGPIAPEGITGTGANLVPNILATLPNGNVITGSPGQSLSDALKLLSSGVGSGAGGISALSQPAVVPVQGLGFGSNQGTSGQVYNLTMNYPQFSSPQGAQKTMTDIVTMLRTVPGLKI